MVIGKLSTNTGFSTILRSTNTRFYCSAILQNKHTAWYSHGRRTRPSLKVLTFKEPKFILLLLCRFWQNLGHTLFLMDSLFQHAEKYLYCLITFSIFFDASNDPLSFRVILKCVKAKSSPPKKLLELLIYGKNFDDFFTSVISWLFWIIFIKKLFGQNKYLS